MDKFIINGGKKLSGSIEISGAKNAILPIMAATLLAKGKSILTNVPNLNDIKMMSHLLRIIGARVDYFEGTLEIDTTNCSYYEAPYEIVSKMRASVNVLGPLIARFGKAKVSLPGGCAIGTRPVDLHQKALEKLGVNINIKHGYILANCSKLKGNIINFEKSSVGATENALCAAVLAKGETNIRNAAMEPEVSGLIDFLLEMGADIQGKGTTHLKIKGVKTLQPVEMEMIPDRIEAGTFLIAGAITKSKISIEKCEPGHLRTLMGKLEETGAKFEIEDNKIKIFPAQNIIPANIETQPFPGFPTDLQAQFLSLMTLADGKSFIKETIFPDRFMHVPELNRLHADIRLEKGIAEVSGVSELSGAEVMATDLRASAALVLAGLAANGQTTISRIYHIDRGYDRIEKKLQQLGADIKRIES